MDIFQAVKEYIDRMLPIDNTMKVLLLDRDTVPILATSYSQTSLLERGVFLVDQIDNKQRKPMKVMRCVIFVRPTRPSLAAVADEVRAARYSGYTLGFSNVLPTDALNAIASADTAELVTRVEEYFADFVALNTDFMIMPSNGAMREPVPLVLESASNAHIQRVSQGLTAIFLAFKRKPLIRVQANSMLAKAVSAQTTGIIKADPDLFDYRAKDTVVLILDRADDPLTPLLTQWTYQAMLHNLIGLDNNKLTLPGSSPEEGYVFSTIDDKFFAENMLSNWGELCQNVRAHVEKYRSSVALDRGNASLEDLKTLVASLPQAKMLSSNVTKHTTVVSHLAKVIKARRLLDVSLLEQHMASEGSEKEHWSRIVEFHEDPSVLRLDVVRLCLIYNLRYEKGVAGSRVEQLLSGTPYLAHVRQLRQLFGNRSPSTIFNSGVIKSVVSYIKGFKDEKNLYTQHEPLLKRTLTAVAQGRLDPEAFPYLSPPSNPAFRPKEIVVCMMGGCTYEEASLVSKINSDPSICGPIKVLLCAPVVHNTWSFLQALEPNVEIEIPVDSPSEQK